jgi:MerR family copper efflux transcriptional regulator
VEKSLTVGKVVRLAVVGVETIRFYERQGLLEEPDRRASGYRQYHEGVVARLRFIRQAKELGFTLKAIAGLHALRHDPAATRSDVREAVRAKVEDIDAKVRDLLQIREVIVGLAGACHAMPNTFFGSCDGLEPG